MTEQTEPKAASSSPLPASMTHRRNESSDDENKPEEQRKRNDIMCKEEEKAQQRTSPEYRPARQSLSFTDEDDDAMGWDNMEEDYLVRAT